MRDIELWTRLGAMSAKPVRILTAKVGLDGHDRGIKVISRALRDAGVEVIYTGLHQTPAQVVEAAIQEDVDGVGISLLSGAHMTLFPEVLRLLRERGGEDIVVFGGGIVPPDDAVQLKAMGVDEVFTPGTSIRAVVEYVERRFGLEKVGAGTR
jgi:methylmalonyl-CoA mutase C-terminal domain/subunit